MKTILSLSWRDIRSKDAGGAEVHTHKMLSAIDKTKYQVMHLSMSDEDKDGNSLPSQETIDGVTYIRKGGFISVIFNAVKLYRKNKKNIDVVIDQCNTHRFFTPLWVPKNKRVFYIHQLTREIWDINLRFPFNKIGKASENLMLKMNRHDRVITVSEDTKKELIKLGYDGDIRIIHNGVSFEPWDKGKWFLKEETPTFVYVGRYSPYKGIDVLIETIGKMKETYPNIKLWILGKKDKEYFRDNLQPICERYSLNYADEEKKGVNIVCHGFVTEEKKLELLSRAQALVFPSVREGWGIPVTEAGCVGTPAVVYDSPGIAEAVDYGDAGYISIENNEKGLEEQMRRVLEDKKTYDEKRAKAFSFSSQFLWSKSGKDFEKFMDEITN